MLEELPAQSGLLIIVRIMFSLALTAIVVIGTFLVIHYLTAA